jgi:hypothetical protein
VPDVGEHAIYRDGGESGETITRRVIEGLVQHLRPGGTGVIVGFARDTNAQPFEQRARDWLGTAAREFDLLFGTDQSQSIEQVVEAQRPRLKGDVDGEVQRLIQRLCDLDTRQFVHGALYVRRTPTAVDDAPLRVRITPQVRPADFDRLLAWRERRRKPGFRDWLADARPHLAPRLELLTRHAVENGELKVSNVLFQIEDAFAVNLRVDTWMVPAISRHNGKRSVVEVFQAAQAAGEFPDGFPLEAFVGLVDTMIERGFLRLDGNTAPCA